MVTTVPWAVRCHGRSPIRVIAVGGILGLALSGGAAVATGLIHGKDLAKGTITSRELGSKSVTSAKLSKSVKKQLSKAGTPGARGPAGRFNYVDQNGTVIGESVGFYSGVYPMVRMGDGTIVLFDNDPANSNAVALVTSIYYQQPGCAGTGYANTGGGVPFQSAIITANPAIPGSQIYKQVPGTPQNFTAASVKNSSGCSASTTAITKAFAVTAAGKVPAVAKPLLLKAAGSRPRAEGASAHAGAPVRNNAADHYGWAEGVDQRAVDSEPEVGAL